MHDRSRAVTIDPRNPTTPGRSKTGFHPPDRTVRAPSAKRGEVVGESHEG